MYALPTVHAWRILVGGGVWMAKFSCRARRRSMSLVGLTVVLVGLQVGCIAPARRSFVDRSNQIPVSELASRLQLEVVRENSTSVTLADRDNVVTIYGDPSGQAYVNGAPVGPSGGFVRLAGEMYAPVDTEMHLRLALESSPTRAVSRDVSPEPETRTPVPERFRVRTGRIIVDAGHGGKDPGAIAVNRLHEKDVNLDVARTLARELKTSGHHVSLTRRDDRFIELDERVAIGNRSVADLFVSIHADAAQNPSAVGFTLYVSRRASAGSLAAAEAIRRQLRRTGVPDRGVRRADFRVLKGARGPSVLVELGFLSNAGEARMLARKSYRDTLAAAIRRGIDDYFSELVGASAALSGT